MILAVPDEFWESTDCCEAVAYTFGINAPGTAEAANIAIAAAENAVDREKRFIGGIVVEVHCRSVNPQEFEGAEKYFCQPLTDHGIFYVSGLTCVAGNFVHRHMTECVGQIVAVYEEDARWPRLDDATREE